MTERTVAAFGVLHKSYRQCTVAQNFLERLVDTEGEVIKDILARQARGLTKYGVSVAGNPLPLRDWLQHQYEELLDAAIYCKRAMQEMDQ